MRSWLLSPIMTIYFFGSTLALLLALGFTRYLISRQDHKALKSYADSIRKPQPDPIIAMRTEGERKRTQDMRINTLVLLATQNAMR